MRRSVEGAADFFTGVMDGVYHGPSRVDFPAAAVGRHAVGA